MSKFITFEGMDGAGKSTHLVWFADALRQRRCDVVASCEASGAGMAASHGCPAKSFSDPLPQAAGFAITSDLASAVGSPSRMASSSISNVSRDVIVTREPGGTPLGEQLREILLNQEMSIGTEAMLMFAARLEHIEQVIKPALQAGKWVISDRFSDASFAYQGGGRGLDWDKLSQLEQWVQGDLQPDLTLFFDVPVEIARQRLMSPDRAGPNNIPLDRFEQEQADFFERVRAGYHRRVRENPQRYVVIDAAQSLEKVKLQLEGIVATI